MSNKILVTTFQIFAVIFIGVAAFLLWRGNYEAVFVASALSSVSYFLSFRYQTKERVDERDSKLYKNDFDVNADLLKDKPISEDIGEFDETVKDGFRD